MFWKDYAHDWFLMKPIVDDDKMNIFYDLNNPIQVNICIEKINNECFLYFENQNENSIFCHNVVDKD